MATLPAVRNASLYELEDDLLALLDTEDMVSDEQRAEYETALQQALIRTVEKRERVGRFIRHLELRGDNIKAEKQRLDKLAKLNDNALGRVKQYVLGVIESQGMDESGRYRKLQGNTIEFSARPCPPSVDITAPEHLPAKFKTAQVAIPAKLWDEVLRWLSPDMQEMVNAVSDVSYSADKKAIKEAITRGEDVPGAELLCGKNSLQVR